MLYPGSRFRMAADLQETYLRQLLEARKLAVEARLRAATGTRPGPERMTTEQIAATVTAVRDLMQALRYAATEDKAEIYAGLNLQLTYHPGERTVSARAEVGQTCTKGSRGDLNPHRPGVQPERFRVIHARARAGVAADCLGSQAKVRDATRRHPSNPDITRTTNLSLFCSI